MFEVRLRCNSGSLGASLGIESVSRRLKCGVTPASKGCCCSDGLDQTHELFLSQPRGSNAGLIAPAGRRSNWLSADFLRVQVGGERWFGGGCDLTPAYLFEEDAAEFHKFWKVNLTCGSQSGGTDDEKPFLLLLLSSSFFPSGSATPRHRKFWPRMPWCHLHTGCMRSRFPKALPRIQGLVRPVLLHSGPKGRPLPSAGGLSMRRASHALQRTSDVLGSGGAAAAPSSVH